MARVLNWVFNEESNLNFQPDLVLSNDISPLVFSSPQS